MATTLLPAITVATPPSHGVCVHINVESKSQPVDFGAFSSGRLHNRAPAAAQIDAACVYVTSLLHPPGMPKSDSPHTAFPSANFVQPSSAHDWRGAATNACRLHVLELASNVNDLHVPGGFVPKHIDAHAAASATVADAATGTNPNRPRSCASSKCDCLPPLHRRVVVVVVNVVVDCVVDVVVVSVMVVLVAVVLVRVMVVDVLVAVLVVVLDTVVLDAVVLDTVVVVVEMLVVEVNVCVVVLVVADVVVTVAVVDVPVIVVVVSVVLVVVVPVTVVDVAVAVVAVAVVVETVLVVRVVDVVVVAVAVLVVVVVAVAVVLVPVAEVLVAVVVLTVVDVTLVSVADVVVPVTDVDVSDVVVTVVVVTVEVVVEVWVLLVVVTVDVVDVSVVEVVKHGNVRARAASLMNAFTSLADGAPPPTASQTLSLVTRSRPISFKFVEKNCCVAFSK